MSDRPPKASLRALRSRAAADRWPGSAGDPPGAHPEALGVIELESLVRGHRVLDAMVKRSPVRVRDARPTSGGKLLIFIDGSVAEVDEAMHAGLAAAGGWLLGDLFLPRCHPGLWEALEGRGARLPIDALAFFESLSVTDVVAATDAALKAADVHLVELHLARGIGGRAYAALAGAQHDADAALEAAAVRLRPDLLVERDLICRPHDDMTLALLGLATLHDPY